MTHNKRNPNKVFNKNHKSHTKGSSQHSFNDVCDDVSKNKVFYTCKYCGKTNHLENIFFKRRHELAKTKKESSAK